jgi:putative ABC transport system substrate-binding protein
MVAGTVPNLNKPTAPGVMHIGILNGARADDSIADGIAGLKQGLSELGYVDGKNIVFAQRDADSKLEVLQELASELIRIPVDMIVSLSASATLAAERATAVIPIVFVWVADPVGKGIVTSLDHPSGNLTGTTAAPPSTYAKVLQFLTQLIPRLSRVAYVTNLDPLQGAVLGPQITTDAANAMGIQLKVLDVRAAEDVDPVLATALTWQADAIMSFGGTGATNDALPRLVDFQLWIHIPLACQNIPAVRAGGLLAYAASVQASGHTPAGLVDKIIKGARPANLPVEQPTVFELVINRTTAQRLGITIPPEVAQQVSEWVT